MKCIICKEERNESDEHIIPEALGNKKLITKRVCKDCNNRLGYNVDDYLVNHPLVKRENYISKLYVKQNGVDNIRQLIAKNPVYANLQN